MPVPQIIAELLDTSAVTARVGSRIRAGRLDRRDTEPAVVVERANVNPVNKSEGTTATKFADVDIHCVAATYGEAEALADLVEAALNGWSNPAGDPAVSSCHVRDVPYNPGPARPEKDQQAEVFTVECLVAYATS